MKIQTQEQTKFNSATIEAPKSSGELVKAAMAKATTKGTLAGLKHNDIQTVINGMKAQIAQALPKHITAERIIQMAVTLVSRNPKIAKCSAESLIGALMQASILGFQPVQALGECYFVPWQNKKNINGKDVWVDEVEFQIGYKGYIKLGQNSSQLKTIYAEIVFETDEFRIKKGLDDELHHIPNPDNTGDEPIKGAYAVAKYMNGGFNFVYLSKKQIEYFRLFSPAQKKYGLSGIWKDHYHAMAKKTCIRRLAPYLPKSIDIQTAYVSDGSIIRSNAFSNNGTGIDLDALDYAQEVEEQNTQPESLKLAAQDNEQWLKENEGENHA